MRLSLSLKICIVLIIGILFIQCTAAQATLPSIISADSDARPEDLSVTFSPFTTLSTHLEVTVNGLPTDVVDGREYDFTVSTDGFIPVSLVELEVIELYKKTFAGAWVDISTVLPIGSFNEKEVVEVFKFNILFNAVKEDQKVYGYERFFRLRFDILEWLTTSASAGISTSVKMASTRTSKVWTVFSPNTLPSGRLAHELEVSLSEYVKNDKNKQKFSAELKELAVPITATSSDLIIYSYFDTYRFEPVNPTITSGLCKFGSYNLPATYINPGDGTQPYLSISFSGMGTATIKAGSTVQLTCNDFIVYKTITDKHQSEYWVAHLTTDDLLVTSYVAGEDRWVHIFAKVARTVLAIILVIILLIIISSAGGSIALCYSKKWLCFKSKEYKTKPSDSDYETTQEIV